MTRSKGHLSAPVLPQYIKGKGAAAPVAPVVQAPLDGRTDRQTESLWLVQRSALRAKRTRCNDCGLFVGITSTSLRVGRFALQSNKFASVGGRN